VDRRSTLPEGAAAIGLGLIVNGLATYAFLIVARRALGDVSYGSLAVLWGLVYILGPGFFRPLEQEIARATANREGRGQGSAPVLRQASRIGLVQLLVIEGAVVAAWPLGLDELLDYDRSLLVVLGLSLAAFMVAECVRGVLSGRHMFIRYGAYFGSEGVVRLVTAVLLAMAGVEFVGAYGTAIALAFVVSAVASLSVVRPFVKPGPPAPFSEVTPALGWLLLASLSEAFLLNIGPVALQIVGRDLSGEAPGIFLNGLIVSRVPLFFFPAVRAAGLPNLARLVGEEDLKRFRDVQLRLVGAVAGAAGLWVAFISVAGVRMVEFLFDDAIRPLDMALMSTGGGGLMILSSLSLGLVALDRMRQAVIGAAVGVIVFVPALMLADDAFLRVELALVASVGIGAVVTAVLLRNEYGRCTRR